MLLWVLVVLGAAGANEEPFWKAKEKYAARVREGEVVVSVVSRGEGEARQLTLAGGGRVKAPVAFTFAFARRFACVARLSGYVTRIEARGDRLAVTFAALGRRAEFEVAVSVDEPARRVAFTIHGGPLDGLRAGLTFAKLDDERTEVAVDGTYAYVNRLKGALVGLGLEGVIKHVAERLRTAVERAQRHPDEGGQGANDCGRIAS